MKLKHALLAASALAAPSVAMAADLPTRKAAPVEYVRVCNAFGAGFFYIPGTDTCLKVGGLVVAQMRIQGASTPYSITSQIGGSAIPAGGIVPAFSGIRAGNGFRQDSVGYDAQARIELDARTQTGYGTLRTFIRLQSNFGAGVNASTGNYNSLLTNPLGWTNTNPTVGKELTYIDKAFIQFAGITMGRAQSFFDFYTNNFQYESLRGSNSTVWTLAYTASFNGGYSATIAVEDSLSRRGEVTSAATGPGLGLGAGTTVSAVTAAARLPDVIAAVRVDQGWGSAQLSAALHPVRAALYTAAGGLSPFQPLNVTNSFGFAVQGGVKFKLDMISKGDELYIQAVYSKGGTGYLFGSNTGFTGNANLTANYGRGDQRLGNSYGWNQGNDYDCVYTYSGKCELSSGFAVGAAYRHFWTPTLSSALYAGYMKISYPGGSYTPIGFNGVANSGVSSYGESRLGTNLVWSPVKDFSIGGEFTWIRAVSGRPFGLASDWTLKAAGLPAFKGTTDGYYGKLRMQRAF